MALIEMKELKLQLEELLEKGPYPLEYIYMWCTGLIRNKVTEVTKV